MSYKATNWAYDLPLVGPQKAVIVALADMADEAGTCFPGHDRIAAMTGWSVSTVARALKQLEARGLITREHRIGAFGYRTSDRYKLQLTVTLPESLPVTAPTRQSAYQAESQFLPVTESIPTGQSDGAIEPSDEPLDEPSDVTPIQGRKRALPSGWSPNENCVSYARANRIDITFEAEQFKADAIAKGKKFTDWDSAFRYWLGNVVKWRKPEPKGGDRDWALRM